MLLSFRKRGNIVRHDIIDEPGELSERKPVTSRFPSYEADAQPHAIGEKNGSFQGL